VAGVVGLGVVVPQKSGNHPTMPDWVVVVGGAGVVTGLGVVVGKPPVDPPVEPDTQRLSEQEDPDGQALHDGPDL